MLRTFEVLFQKEKLVKGKANKLGDNGQCCQRIQDNTIEIKYSHSLSRLVKELVTEEGNLSCLFLPLPITGPNVLRRILKTDENLLRCSRLMRMLIGELLSNLVLSGVPCGLSFHTQKTIRQCNQVASIVVNICLVYV